MSSRIHHVEVSRRDQMGIALGWASLFLLVVGVLWYFGNSTLVLWNKAILVAGAVLGIGYLAVRKDAALAVVTSRAAGGHANATVFILAVLAIVGCINYIASRRTWQFDLTRQRLFTLSPQTKEVLKGLKEEVKVTAFYQLAGRGGAEGQKARDLLKQYQDVTKKIKFEMIDPVAQPARAAQLGVTSQSVWLESGGRKETVYTLGEQEVTSAVIKVTRPTKKKVYFLFGHGEKDIESVDARDGMSGAKQILERLNYEVSKLILQTVKEVPADAAVVVVAGPRKGIPANEQKMLADYLTKGGKLLLMLDAPVQAGTYPVPTQLIQPWGIEVGNNVVIDPRMPQAGFAFIPKFEFHQITKDLQAAYFPLARSVSAAASPPAGMTVTSLAKSADVAWGETKMSGSPQQDPEDQRGPLSLAVVVEKTQVQDSPNQENDTKKSTRLVVVGDADFATDQMFQSMNSSGGDFFLNAVNWLAEEEALVSIRPKEPEQTQITLVGSQARFIGLTTVVIIPLLVLFSGVFVWWRRR